LSLNSHLKKYGIQHFETDEYWTWVTRKLKQKRTMELSRLREPLQSGVATDHERAAFYDYIARQPVAGVVHSMKADAIRASGSFAAHHLGGRREVLDIGCSLGYLTTWFAQLQGVERVVGLDASARTIREAQKFSQQSDISSCEFIHGKFENWSNEQCFDAIVSCQMLYNSEDLNRTLGAVRERLKPEGILISIEAAPTAEGGRAYLEALSDAELCVVQFDWVMYNDLGRLGAYLGFVVAREGQPAALNIEAEYKNILRKLR